MNCVLIDDELLAHEVVEYYIQKTPGLNLTAKFSDAISFIKYVGKFDNIDLVFLDINMPEISGLELLKIIKVVPDVIFTTAYSQFALDAYNLNAIDYLTKPFSYERFLQAIQKCKVFGSDNEMNYAHTAANSFYVKCDKKLVNIFFEDILLIEGNKNYIVIVLDSLKKYIVHSTLINIDALLSICSYISRVHRSFFVNTKKIIEIQGNDIVLKNGLTVPIGLSFREAFFNSLKVL
jgi:DNA-binding LytR/AlgR family response regulator